jgi:manganese efflux pump family protein
MVLFRIVAIGFTLAMDSMVVSISLGVLQQKYRLQQSLFAGLNFGFFQVLFFVSGTLLNSWTQSYIGTIERWISFTILLCIGIKMIVEARKGKDDEGLKGKATTLFTYFFLGIATSIDAFAVGFTFSSHNIPFIPTTISVFGFSFLWGFLGIWMGSVLRKRNVPVLPYLSGILLCLLGFLALFY